MADHLYSVTSCAVSRSLTVCCCDGRPEPESDLIPPSKVICFGSFEGFLKLLVECLPELIDKLLKYFGIAAQGLAHVSLNARVKADLPHFASLFQEVLETVFQFIKTDVLNRTALGFLYPSENLLVRNVVSARFQCRQYIRSQKAALSLR